MVASQPQVPTRRVQGPLRWALCLEFGRVRRAAGPQGAGHLLDESAVITPPRHAGAELIVLGAA